MLVWACLFTLSKENNLSVELGQETLTKTPFKLSKLALIGAVMKKTALAFTIVLTFSIIFGVQFVNVAEANWIGPDPPLTAIFIKTDGSIDPSNAPIKKVGDVYTLTEDMLSDYSYYSFIIQRDNIEFDGAGHTIHSHIRTRGAIYIRDRKNVTVKNFSIVTTGYGIAATNSLHITFVANNITSASEGILLTNCSESTVSQNSFNNNYQVAIWLRTATKSNITQNSITWSRGSTYSPAGIHLSNSSDCIISGNNVSKSAIGICFSLSSNNFIYANNFIFNDQPVFDEAHLAGSFLDDLSPLPFSVNIWDNSALGNYWSNYNGTDSNGDGIGDVPYIIDANNTDNFPLMSPFANPIIPPIPSSDAESPEPFSTSLVIASIIIIIVVVVAAFLFYMRKHKHQLKKD